jgi:hypothetical protein
MNRNISSVTHGIYIYLWGIGREDGVEYVAIATHTHRKVCTCEGMSKGISVWGMFVVRGEGIGFRG